MKHTRYRWMIVGVMLVILSGFLYGQGALVDLGKAGRETGRYLKMIAYTSGDGQIKYSFISPEYCVQNVGTSMYFDLDNNYFYKQPKGKYNIVNVEYYDAPGVKFKLVYDAQNNANAEAGTVTTTGTNKWMSVPFYLTDAYFGDRGTNNSDFKIVCTQGTMSVNAVSMVPFDYYIDFGNDFTKPDSNDCFNITQKEYQGGDSKTRIVTVADEPCIQTLVASNYLYCAMEDSLIYNGNHPYLFVSVVYYDESATNRMRLQYDGSTAAYVSTAYVSGKGWGSFRSYTFEIADGLFTNRENGGSDMRLQIDQPGLKIARLTIGVLPKKGLPNPTNIANSTAFKALESPTIDGSLTEWGWLNNPVVTQPTWNAAGDRTDEFFRTWFLNNDNVPTQETGETGVTGTGVAGLWDLKDLTGNVRLLWDDTNLYFAVIVKDNVVTVNGTKWKEKDGFGFYIDVSHTYTTSGGQQVPVAIKDDNAYQAGEHFIFLTATNADLGYWIHSSSPTGEALPNTVKKSFVKTDTGYVIEASIPLAMLKETYTWTPGAGGKDDFSPLFAWVLNDADNVSPMSGRLMYGGDSEDDEFWGTLSLSPIPLVDKGITADLGSPNYENFITQINKTGAGAVDIVQKGAKTCAMTKGGKVYFDVSDAVINAGNHPRLLVMVEYFDTQESAQFRVEYDGATSATTATKWVTVGNSQQWKTAIFEINDAKFSNGQSGADLSVVCPTNNLYLNQVRVAIKDLWIDLGTTASGWGIKETQLASDGTRKPTNVGGVDCIMNDRATASNANYLYHTVADTQIFQGNHKELLITVEYYDTTSTGAIGLNYDGVSNQWSNAIGNVYILGTNQWKLHTYYVNDANFANRENGGSDFRVALQGGTALFVNRIMIGSTDPLKYMTVTAVGRDGNLPFVFDLAQNYPNPFNPATVIKYELPKEGSVTLRVYNILGQLVDVLVQGNQAAGVHFVNWNATKFSTGVYLYTLQQGDRILTKKLMLVK